MSRLHRRLRVPVARLLLVLLVAPAAVACCVEMSGAMACCTHDDRRPALSMACCVVDAESAPASQAPTTLVARDEGQAHLAATPEARVFVTIDRSVAYAGANAGPSGGLYIRLSVIRC